VARLVGAGPVTAFQAKAYQASATILIAFYGETLFDDIYYATEASRTNTSAVRACRRRWHARKSVAWYRVPPLTR
jgi:hypothetical protein